LKAQLDNGGKLPLPDGILINGRSSGATLNIEPGITLPLCMPRLVLGERINL